MCFTQDEDSLFLLLFDTIFFPECLNEIKKHVAQFCIAITVIRFESFTIDCFSSQMN